MQLLVAVRTRAPSPHTPLPKAENNDIEKTADDEAEKSKNNGNHVRKIRALRLGAIDIGATAIHTNAVDGDRDRLTIGNSVELAGRTFELGADRVIYATGRRIIAA